MSDNQTPIDVDGMSEEELDNFLEEATGVDLNEPTDVIDEEDTADVVIPDDETSVEPEETEVSESEEDETNVSESEDTVVEDDEIYDTEGSEVQPSDVESISMEGYEQNELATMTEVYEDLFKTGIKASGVDRTVRDAEHLKTLVRIGFSANENNRKIKPYLRQLKSLEQAGVSLEDDNLNFLVDVMSGNKDALKELVKNKFNMEEDELQSWYDEDGEGSGKAYVANDHVISDSRFQLQEILEDIKTTPTYDRTVNFLSNIDDDGKALISREPELVNLLNNDMQSGIFDKAVDEANFRMDRGLLPKQSILQSYIAVMQDEEFFNSLTGKPEVTEKKPVANTQVKKEVVSRKKRASTVGTSKGATQGSQKQTVNTKDINKMSADEFDDFYASLDIDD